MSGPRAKILAAALLLLAGLGSAPSSAAQTRDAMPRGFDLGQPIEINADSLVLRQQDRTAVFDGNVDAVQGQIRLRADQLIVHYRPEAQGDENGAAAVGGSITRIDARGTVSITSPNETAKGEAGVYDVVKRIVTLQGDVVLTQGDNVLRGERLVINLGTGVSQLDGTKKGQGSGRVKAVFTPNRAARTQ